MSGRTIKLFIMGDKYKNLKSAELSNWTGKAFIGERKHVQTIQSVEELQAPGIYFLLSTNEETNQTILYIGEADEAASRLKQHHKKDWWDKFVVFTSKDSNLTKAHVRYLEKEFYEVAKTNFTTIELKNGSTPTGSNLPECDKADMSVFKDNLIFIMDNLGVINFAQLNQEEKALTKEEKIFYLNLTKDRKDKDGNFLGAKLVITDNGYKLLQGSFVEATPRESFKTHNYFKLRQKLEKELFTTSEVKGALITIKDIPFTSPSAAAAIVKNRAINGKDAWKLEDGITIDEYESEINFNE